VAGALDVNRLLESCGGAPWYGPFAAPGGAPPRLGSDDGRQAGRTHPPRGASRRILLVDDQATDLDSLRLILVLQGYAVDCVQLGVEGLRRALSGDYGLVILDLHLIDLPGLDVLGRFRATDGQTPVIVITGVCLGEEHEARARALGISAFLHKPIFDDDLVPAVRAAMDATSPPVFEDGANVQPPLRTRFAELHGRLLASDRRAADDLCSLLVAEIRRQIRPRDPLITREMIDEALDDTLTELVAAPGRCDPARDPIAWLATIARNKLKDAGRALRRRRRREVALTENLERALEAPAGLSAEELADRRAWIASHRRQLLAVAKTGPEQRFLEARLHGAPVNEQAAALGGGELREPEQRALVNRVWERLRLRLVRSMGARPGRRQG
jgi:two-component system, LuxR family, response regulator FixJ